MKRFLPTLLPKFCKNPDGFTLVELLITVSILAILTVVGLAVFGNSQGKSRDVRRQADINAIAQALESNYVEATGQYPALSTTLFSGGKIPKDPLDGASNCNALLCMYCVNPASETGCASATDTKVAGGAPGAGATYKVCANLEAGGTFCRSNQR